MYWIPLIQNDDKRRDLLNRVANFQVHKNGFLEELSPCWLLNKGYNLWLISILIQLFLLLLHHGRRGMVNT